MLQPESLPQQCGARANAAKRVILQRGPVTQPEAVATLCLMSRIVAARISVQTQQYWKATKGIRHKEAPGKTGP